MSVIEGGVVIEGGIPRSLNPFATVRRVLSGGSIQTAHDAAVAGDIIAIEPGEYDEAVVITKNNLVIVGLGVEGAVAVAPSASDGIAWTIDGTAGARVKEVGLVNLGGEGNGNGGGLHIKGDIRRIRLAGGKYEGGTFGMKLESTAQGSVGDIRMRKTELGWTTRGLHITASGGGDPVTNVRGHKLLLHNCSAKWILSDVAHTTGLWITKTYFAKEEDASAPVAGQLDVAVASSEGLFAGNYFDLDTMAVATLVIAAGIRWVGNMTEAGVGGRPA